MSGEKSVKIDTEGYERLKLEDMNIRGAYNLSAAIVRQAAHDWMKAAKKTHGRSRIMEECESFFRSGYFQAITGLDGEYVLDRLRSML